MNTTQKLISLVLAVLIGLAPTASYAQTLVFDAKALVEAKSILTTARSSLREVTETVNQVRMVVNQGKELLRIVGNPALLLRELGLGEVMGLLHDVMELNNFGRQTFAQICSLADEVKSLTSAAQNPFSSGRELGLMVNGQSRDTGRYRAWSVFETAFSGHQDVVEKDRRIQAEAARKMKEATAKLQSASTEADREAARAGIEAARAVAEQSRAQAAASAGQVSASYQGADLALRKDSRMQQETAELMARSLTPEMQATNARIEAGLFGR